MCKDRNHVLIVNENHAVNSSKTGTEDEEKQKEQPYNREEDFLCRARKCPDVPLKGRKAWRCKEKTHAWTTNEKKFTTEDS